MADLFESNAEVGRWLPLGQAAKHLGVHSTTLRRWADNGVIPFLLTPGGHRRFALSDLDAFQNMHKQKRSIIPVEQAWAEKAMTQTRRALAEPSAEPWLVNMADDHRERHRRLGRQLMGLTLQYISSDETNGHLLQQAREIGYEYGQISKEINLPLTDALQAALYFRDELIEVALQLPESTRIRPADNLRLMRRINVLLNAVHLGIAEIFEQSGTVSAD